jgi:hypothetical protein
MRAYSHQAYGTTSVPTARRKSNAVSFAAGRQCRWQLVWNVRTWPAMPREKAQAAPTARPKVPMRRRGADCLVGALKRGNARGAKGAGHRHWIGSTGNGTSPIISGRRQPSCDGTSRMNREVHVRICERLGVRFPGPTRQKRQIKSAHDESAQHQTSAEMVATQRTDETVHWWPIEFMKSAGRTPAFGLKALTAPASWSGTR